MLEDITIASNQDTAKGSIFASCVCTCEIPLACLRHVFQPRFTFSSFFVGTQHTYNLVMYSRVSAVLVLFYDAICSCNFEFLTCFLQLS